MLDSLWSGLKKNLIQLSMNSVIIFDHVVEKAILFSLDFVSSHTHVCARLKIIAHYCTKCLHFKCLSFLLHHISIHVLRNQLNVQCFCNFMSRYKVIIPPLHYMYISHKLKMYILFIQGCIFLVF